MPVRFFEANNFIQHVPKLICVNNEIENRVCTMYLDEYYWKLKLELRRFVVLIYVSLRY